MMEIFLRNSMKRWIVALVIFFSTSLVLAEQPVQCKQIRIFVPDRQVLSRIWSTGIDYEGMSGKIGDWMEFIAGETELDQLKNLGISFEVIVDNLAEQYASQLSAGPVNALGFGYGSMGGFYTYAEVVQQLDSMRLLYPSLITVRDSIGKGRENRALWAVKISDNPSVNESGEPEVLYTALHHAREPQGMMTVIYYMWWLLENYATNAEAAYLVNTRQMWFIPVVNPDGYVYNQTTNPTGGGMWRKNRRNNGDATTGVDLNRNYGPTYMWNAANGGSSTTTSSDTYRGTAAFSEPETQAIDLFMRARNIKTALNYHTYGNYLIYPFGYLSSENSDSLVYRDWAYDMTYSGRYTNGTDQQTVNYSTRGNSDDYMFGDTTKFVTYTMTPEVGTTGFWPSSSLIFPLAIENLPSNKLLSYFAGHYPKVRYYQIQEQDSNGIVSRGENFNLLVQFKNIGLGKASNLNVTLSSNVAWIQIPSPTIILDSVSAKSTAQVVFAGSVSPSAPGASAYKLFLTFSDADGFSKQDTLNLLAGAPTVVFSDSASTGTAKWTTGSGWGTTSNAHSAPSAFTDSPSGNYAANANNALTMVNAANLTGYLNAELRYWIKWSLEPTWDFAVVEISTNSGSTWSYLRASYSRPGSTRSGGQQPAGSFGYDSYTPGLAWAEQSIDLSAYVNKQIKIRFRLGADGGEERDGVYVDDIRIFGIHEAVSAPLAPSLVFPADGTTGHPFPVTLKWSTALNATSYRLQIATDSLFTSIALDDSTISDTTTQVNGLLAMNQYFWRVSAKNTAGSSGFTTFWIFTTSIAPPSSPLLISPPNGVSSQPLAVDMTWSPEPTAAAYHLQASPDSLFGTLVVNDSTITDTNYTTAPLAYQTTYFWRVRAINAGGRSAFSSSYKFATLIAPPAATVLVAPPDDSADQPTILSLRWRQSQNAQNYRLQLSLDSLFTQLVLNDSSLADTLFQLDSLELGTGYFWRVRGENTTLPGAWSPAWDFVTTLDVSRQYSLSAGWNLLSMPLTVDDARTGNVFPAAISQAYGFSNSLGYVLEDTLQNGAGYWLKFADVQGAVLTGQVRLTDTLAVVAGWNLLGSITEPIAVSSIQEVPSGLVLSPYYVFQGSYVPADTLEPAKGYWVKAGQNGVLILTQTASTPALEPGMKPRSLKNRLKD